VPLISGVCRENGCSDCANLGAPVHPAPSPASGRSFSWRPGGAKKKPPGGRGANDRGLEFSPA
jgi:hypothetical protein